MTVTLQPRASVVVRGMRVINDGAIPISLVLRREANDIKIDNQPFPRDESKPRPITRR